MENIKISWALILKILKWVFLFLIVVYIILLVARAVYRVNEAATSKQVEKIHNTKLTMDDVIGKNLPPDPGSLADQTIEGIDANKNGIRDDVELAIFNAYPDSAKTRAVLLQYALALQMEVVQPVVNTEIATEVVREQSRGFECIGDILSRENSKEFDKETNFLTEFVKEKQFNTKERQDARNVFLEKIRSYSGLQRVCDINYSQLPN